MVFFDRVELLNNVCLCKSHAPVLHRGFGALSLRTRCIIKEIFMKNQVSKGICLNPGTQIPGFLSNFVSDIPNSRMAQN